VSKGEIEESGRTDGKGPMGKFTLQRGNGGRDLESSFLNKKFKLWDIGGKQVIGGRQ